jgi:release factor glutamine methyltransferase
VDGPTNGSSAVAFELFGTGAVVTIAPSALAERVRQSLPRAAHQRPARTGDVAFALDSQAGNGYRVAGPHQEQPVYAADADDAIARLRTELIEHVALRAPDHVFVRGGAVAMGGRAILLPGEPDAGTASLVAALVRAGATHYADEHVPIDTAGRVHALDSEAPQPPAPIAVIAMVTYRERAQVALHDRPTDDAILALLRHARAADGRPEFALRAARAAAKQALVLEGQRDSADAAAATLIERLARLPEEGPQPQQELPPKMQFVSLVLELEGELVALARTLEEAGVDAVLLNGDEVRPALAHGFAFAFSAEIEIPSAQVPRALGALESARWVRIRPTSSKRYFRGGVMVRIRRRPRRQRVIRGRGLDHGPVAKGRFGFAEPADTVAVGPPTGVLGPVPFDSGDAPDNPMLGSVRHYAAEALTAVDTFRLRTRERDFHGMAMQHGPGVFGFETVAEQHVDAILARLPKEGRVRVVEVGTATGAVALKVAEERPDADVLATDVSLRALGWARRNRRRLGVRNIRFVQGSLLAPVPAAWRGEVAAIAANLPLALPAMGVEFRGVLGWPIGTATGPGADGLGLIRALARDACDVLKADGHLHLQLNGRQGPWIAPYLAELGYEADIPSDASKRGTVEIAARWPGSARP